MAPSPWLLLIEYIIILLGQFCCCYIFSKVIFKRWKSNDTSISSPCIIFYFYVQVLSSAITFIHMIYSLSYWRPYPIEQNAFFLFYLGTIQVLCTINAPISVFSLGLDRCLCVLFPIKYTKHENSYPKYFAILIMFGLSAFSMITFIIPTYPTTSTTFCLVMGCMVPAGAINIFYYLRCFTSALLFFNGIILFGVMRWKLSITQKQNKKFNNTVLYTLLITLLLDFAPHILSTLFFAISGENLVAYAGSYSTVMASIESGVCALFYRNIYKQTSTKVASLPFNRSTNVTIYC